MLLSATDLHKFYIYNRSISQHFNLTWKDMIEIKETKVYPRFILVGCTSV